jgi:hypothetical protein
MFCLLHAYYNNSSIKYELYQMIFKIYRPSKIIIILKHITRPCRKERYYSCYMLFISSTYEYFSYIL